MAPPRIDLLTRLVSKVKTTSGGCWLFQGGAKQNKYGLIGLGGRGARNVKAHRAMWYAVHGVLPSEFILHKCDRPKCINPNHLKLGTHEENMRQMVERNQQAKGQDNGNSKLKEHEIKAIRYFYSTGEYSQRVLGEMYDVSKTLIRYVVHRKIWQHVD